MLFFIPRSRLPRWTLAAVSLGLPFAVSGACGGGTACFQYTQAEYSLHGSSCPAQQDALPNFSSPACPGAITAVNSAGSFDGEICCYAVTYSDIVPDCGSSNGNGNGVGGFSGGTTGFTATTSATGVGPPPPCSNTCSEVFKGSGPPCSNPALSFFIALQSCACNSGGIADGGLDCSGQCGALCSGGPLDMPCSSCLTAACSSQLNTCSSN